MAYLTEMQIEEKVNGAIVFHLEYLCGLLSATNI